MTAHLLHADQLDLHGSISSAIDPGAHLLAGVLGEALLQCVSGKGAQRHGRGQKLLEQQWVSLAQNHGPGFLTGQACKKLNEAASMYARDGVSARAAYERELLGAIVYAGFAIIHLRNQ